jgi:hypothetical protein
MMMSRAIGKRKENAEMAESGIEQLSYIPLWETSQFLCSFHRLSFH